MFLLIYTISYATYSPYKKSSIIYGVLPVSINLILSYNNLNIDNYNFIIILDWLNVFYTILFALMFSTLVFISSAVVKIPVQCSKIIMTSKSLFVYDVQISNVMCAYSIFFLCVLIFCMYCDCSDEAILGVKIMLFYVSIFTLVTSENLFTSIIFFEMIGIISFRLIGHYIFRINAARGATVSISINKIGDFMLIGIIFWVGTNYFDSITNWLIIVFILALSVKSVAFLSFLWLLDAMEGASHVSALLHSATLVIAGIIVFIRNAKISCGELLFLLFIFGLIITTMTLQNSSDTKKTAATSTCILIALIFLILISSPKQAWQMAIIHAQYKTLIFFTLSIILCDNSTQCARSSNLITRLTSGLIIGIFIFCVGTANSKYLDVKSNLKVVRMFHDLDSISSPSIFIMNWSLLLFCWTYIFFIIASNNILNYNFNSAYYSSLIVLIIFSIFILIECINSSHSGLDDMQSICILIFLLINLQIILSLKIRTLRIYNISLLTFRTSLIFVNSLISAYIRLISKHYNVFWLPIIILFLII